MQAIRRTNIRMHILAYGEDKATAYPIRLTSIVDSAGRHQPIAVNRVDTSQANPSHGTL